MKESRTSPLALLTRRRGALLVSLVYAFLAGLYIWLSGQAVLWLAGASVEAQHRWEVAKGWAYVLVTAAGLYLLLRLVYRQALEQRRAAQERAEVGERFAALVNLSPDAILIHRDGVIKFANWAAARMWGAQSPQELVGKPALDLVAPAFRPVVQQRVAQALATGQPAPPLVEEFLRLDGSTFRGEAAAAPLTYEGRPAMEVVVRDVTEREKAEAALREGQKLQAIGALAGGLAHDLNNLLQAFSALLFSARSKLEKGQKVEEELVSLEQLITQGAALTRQLLLFSRQGPSKKERLDLNLLGQRLEPVLRRLLPENIAFTFQPAGEPLVVEADANQLQQVLFNLVLNARDAMPEGGSLHISLRATENHALLQVKDTGGGIPEEIRPRIFEPFFSTKGQGAGTGLGLAVVHGIVTAHQGRVEVESQVGLGSSFSVFLPLASGPLAEEKEAPGPLPLGSGERVLLVEDEEAAREALAEVLRSLGYQVTAVASAEEAGCLPAEPAFQVLLTDFLLPGANGLQLATGLLKRWPGLKVVVMSGYSEDQLFKEQVEAGLLRFLPKPFTMEQLAQQLRAALGSPS